MFKEKKNECKTFVNHRGCRCGQPIGNEHTLGIHRALGLIASTRRKLQEIETKTKEHEGRGGEVETVPSLSLPGWDSPYAN